MKILILSFYYYPDLCAGSFRTTAFVGKLREKLTSADSIVILTTMPNRYKSYNTNTNEIETIDNIKIIRINIPSHSSGMFDQARSYIKYMFSVLKYTKGENYDLIYSTTSRLFTGFLGAIIARTKHCPLYLDIRDIFTETISEVIKSNLKYLILPVLKILENFTINQANTINFVSEGFYSYFKERLEGKKYTFYTNGIDQEFLDREYKSKNPYGSDTKTILYAGNIGEGQGLDKIIPNAAKLLGNEYEFLIVGDGGKKQALEKAIDEAGASNIKLCDPVNRDSLITLYSECDYLFLHLNDYDAFKRVLPSKLFEYAATGKPIIAGISGYAREFVENNINNCIVFSPCNSEELVHKVRIFSIKTDSRKSFIEKYRRDAIMDKMSDDFINLIQKSEVT